MERQEFNLNEYSLEVKDGKAVLERKGSKEPQRFKPGDVLTGDVGQVVIYAGKRGCSIVTYCGYRRDINHFTDRKDIGWGYINEFDYATDEQKAMLFAEIEKRGYVWDAEKLELRKREFKVGDFICFGDDCIGIYNQKSNNVGKFWTRCFLDKDKFTSYCSEHPYTNVRLASEEEKKRLLAAIDKGGFIWDYENSKMKKKFDFEDGAFVADADGDLFIHRICGDTDFSHGSYVYWNRESDDIVLDPARNMTTAVRFATEEAIIALLDRLAKEGLEWDSKNKRLRKKRWRAAKGKEYWHAEFGQGVTRAFSSVEMGREVDDFRYEQGNYYMYEYDVLKDIDELEI